MKITCPHCGNKGNISHSEILSDAVKDVYVNCTNPCCQARFVMSIAHKHDIIPPKITFNNAIEEMIANIPLKERLQLLRKHTPAQGTLF